MSGTPRALDPSGTMVRSHNLHLTGHCTFPVGIPVLRTPYHFKSISLTWSVGEIQYRPSCRVHTPLDNAQLDNDAGSEPPEALRAWSFLTARVTSWSFSLSLPYSPRISKGNCIPKRRAEAFAEPLHYAPFSQARALLYAHLSEAELPLGL